MCVNFCPVEVFRLETGGAKNVVKIENPSACWACDTCVGQCPTNAIRIIETAEEAAEREQRFTPSAPPLDPAEQQQYRQWHEILTQTLGLRWNPVAISLIGKDQPLPDAPMPRVKLRYC